MKEEIDSKWAYAKRKKHPIDASGWLFELLLLADISRRLWGSRLQTHS